MKPILWFSKSNNLLEQMQLWETESVFYMWKGIALWDSSSPRVQQLAGKFGQQTRMVVTTDCQRKVCPLTGDLVTENAAALI